MKEQLDTLTANVDRPVSLPAGPTGLTEVEASERLRSDGPNELPSAKPKSILALAFQVLREPMFLLLIATGAVYLVLGSLEEAVALLGAIFVVIGITLYQEHKTEGTLQALQDLSSPRALVIRDGQRKRIAGREVVRGDLLVLAEGDRVPADALVLSAVNLTVDESLLTGESVPVRKGIWDGQSDIGRPGGDGVPAVFSGSLIVQGAGVAVAKSTAVRTEIGRLGLSLQKIETQHTNLERETRGIVRLFALISAVLCVLVALIYGLTRGSWLGGALAGLALAISMVPEEFPVVLTIFLALGAWRISRKRVLTRRVPAIEMLGSATVLCVDKTGTLTMNRMAVREVIEAEGHTRDEVLAAASRASRDDPVDPMEKAIHEAAVNCNRDATGPAAILVREYPLSSELLAMSRVLAMAGGDYQVFAKGAPEAIAQLCGLSVSAMSVLVRRLADRGLRVIGVAHACIPKGDLPGAQTDFAFDFLGLLALEDPVRPAVPAAIRECDAAGIRVVMITGDYPATAQSIARQIGLKNSAEIITGPELAAMSAEHLCQRVRTVNVFARVLPEQKLRLVEAFK